MLKNFDQYVLGIKWIKIDIDNPSDWDHFLRLVSLEYIYQYTNDMVCSTNVAQKISPTAKKPNLIITAKDEELLQRFNLTRKRLLFCLTLSTTTLT